MTCEECGATWRRSARFCGRCGAALRAERHSAEPPRRRGSPVLRRWAVAVVAAGCLVVFGGVALVIGEPWETPQSAPSQDVEVPPPPEGTAPEGTAPDAVEQHDVDRAPPTPAVLCRPEPCERWRIDLPSGTSVVDGDTAYHVGRTDWRTEMTAVDLDTGEVRWRATMVVPDAVNGDPLDGRPPALLTGRDDVIIVAADGLLQARSRTDGAVVWALEREGLLPYGLEHGPADTVFVRAGLRALGNTAEPGWSSEAILSIDADTGDLRWERDVRFALAPGQMDEGVVLAITDPDGNDEERAREEASLVALDTLTGEPLWQRPMPHHGFGTSGSTLQVHGDDGVELWDIWTGEPLELPLADRLPEGFDIEVVGELIAVRSYPDDDVPGELSPDHRQHLVVLDGPGGDERFAASAPGWVAMNALADGGAVVASGEDELLLLTALGPDGQVGWELELGLPSDTHWPRWPHVLDDGTIAIIAAEAPGVPELAGYRIDAASGEVVESFHLDVDVEAVARHGLELRWPVAIDERFDGAEIRLHGPVGSLETTQYVQLLSIDPLVVRTPSGTLARLDEQLLLGGS